MKELSEEILDNIREDRKVIVEVRDNIIRFIDESEEKVVTFEGITRLSDTLTKMNAQLIEILKLNKKNAKEVDKDDHAYKDFMFEEIESRKSDKQ